jgi:hypothetical protein
VNIYIPALLVVATRFSLANMVAKLPYDIVRLILEYVDSPAELAAWALVNRNLSEVALNKLWSRIDGFYTLAKCMPESLWIEREITREDEYYLSYKERVIVSSLLRYIYTATQR